MVSSPRSPRLAATLLIAISSLCGAPSSLAATRRSLVDVVINDHDTTTTATTATTDAVADASRDADAGAGGVDAAPACVDGDDEIRLGWPQKFTPPLTTQEQRRRAVSPLDSRTARRLLLKLGPLLLGERAKLVIGTIGGSVTTGLKREHNDYPTQFASGLREALAAMAPDTRWDIQSRNAAQGGTGSGYFALCVNRHLAFDTDLALVELNVNDGTDRAFERVHRKILARESNAALLEVLVENWLEKTPGEVAPVIPGDKWRSRLPVLDHYGVPYVSQALALGPEVARDSTSTSTAGAGAGAASGRRFDIVEWLDKEDVRDIREHYFISLGKHMLETGHRMMAEMLMEVVMALARRHGCKSTLREAMARAKADEEEEARAGGVGAKAPYYPNIVERRTESCVTPKQILRLSRAEGWALKDERSARGEHKFGVVATQPGAWLNMSIDTRPTLGGSGGFSGGGGASAHGHEIDDSHATVTIAYLASYEHMGRVTGSCGGGCGCDDFTIDALWERRSSELQLCHVRTAPPAEHCRVNLRLDEGTGDARKEHKFKVLQVTVQEDFVEGRSVAGHEEGGLMNYFASQDDVKNFGETFDAQADAKE